MSPPAGARRPSIDIQDRDLQLLLGLFESRVMTVHHISFLYFEGRIEAARKRVQKLKAAGYVNERPRKAYEPSVYFMTRKSFELLSHQGMLEGYPRLGWASLEKRVRVSPLTLAHELAVQDARAALEPAFRKAGYTVAEFSTWPVLFEFAAAKPTGERVVVRPDGFVRIQEAGDGGASSEQFFFLEVDRSTEPQERLAQRAACYLDYYRRGGLAARFGHSRSAYRDFPFRCLFVFRTAERRNNTAERLLLNRPPVLTMAWMTTAAELAADPLGPVWVRPLDYRAAVRGTDYDVDGAPDLTGYRRRPGREVAVEKVIAKHRLLTAETGGTMGADG